MTSKVLGVVKLLIVGLVITALMLSGMAFCVHRFDWGESLINAGVIAVYGLSTLVGGFLLAYREKKRRLICGIAYGVMYFAVLCIVSFAVGAGNIDVQAMLKSMLACVVFGGIGGILVK